MRNSVHLYPTDCGRDLLRCVAVLALSRGCASDGPGKTPRGCPRCTLVTRLLHCLPALLPPYVHNFLPSFVRARVLTRTSTCLAARLPPHVLTFWPSHPDACMLTHPPYRLRADPLTHTPARMLTLLRAQCHA